MSYDQQSEIDQNFEFFQTIVSRLAHTHSGKYALLHAREVVAFFESAADAAVAGYKQFSDGLFSIQRVAAAPLDLGFYSHAAGQGKDCQ